MRLPDSFAEQMKMMLGDEYNDYLDALEKPMYRLRRCADRL